MEAHLSDDESNDEHTIDRHSHTRIGWYRCAATVLLVSIFSLTSLAQQRQRA